MGIRELKTFVTAAEYMNFSKAAESDSCNVISDPPVQGTVWNIKIVLSYNILNRQKNMRGFYAGLQLQRIF